MVQLTGSKHKININYQPCALILIMRDFRTSFFYPIFYYCFIKVCEWIVDIFTNAFGQLSQIKIQLKSKSKNHSHILTTHGVELWHTSPPHISRWVLWVDPLGENKVSVLKKNLLNFSDLVLVYYSNLLKAMAWFLVFLTKGLSMIFSA